MYKRYGTTFRIFLPKLEEKKVKTKTGGKRKAFTGGHETILLVEDEKPILEMAKQMLSELGYNVLSASTPGEAIKIAKNYTDEIDVLLTDVIMPEMNGKSLAKKIVGIYPNIKRLFISGYTDNIITNKTKLEKGSYFIQKPFSLPILAEKIQEALKNKK